MVNLKLNGKDIQAPDGMTVLQAAAEAGVIILSLCAQPGLHPYAGCRLCVVDVKGSRTPLASCALQVSEGMEVETHNAALEKSRKTILELLLSNYHDSGYENGQ